MYISKYQASNISVAISILYYRKVSNIIRTLVGNKIVDHSDVVGASLVSAAPKYSFLTYHMASIVAQRQQQDETRNIYVLGLGASYIR